MHRKKPAAGYPKVACLLAFSKVFLYLVVASGTLIIPVRCQIIGEFRYPKKALPDCVINTFKEYIPETRAKYSTLKDFVLDGEHIGVVALHHDSCFTWRQITVQKSKHRVGDSVLPKVLCQNFPVDTVKSH